MSKLKAKKEYKRPSYQTPSGKNKFSPRVQDAWLRSYAQTHRILESCDAIGIKYDVVRSYMRQHPEFEALKEQLDMKDIELTRNKLRQSAHGYEIPELKEEQELQIDPRFPPKYIPDPNPKNAGKFIIDPANPGKYHWVVTKRVMTSHHFPPNPSTLQFKLCNEDSTNYKNINHIEERSTVKLDADVSIGVEDKTLADLANAIVQAKAKPSK